MKEYRERETMMKKMMDIIEHVNEKHDILLNKYNIAVNDVKVMKEKSEAANNEKINANMRVVALEQDKVSLSLPYSYSYSHQYSNSCFIFILITHTVSRR